MMRNALLVIGCVASALATHTSSAQATYRRATIDSTGQLRIELATQITYPRKDSGQVATAEADSSNSAALPDWTRPAMPPQTPKPPLFKERSSRRLRTDLRD